MDEELLAGIERLLASSPRRKASDDLTPDEKVTILVENSNLVQAVPDLVAEVRRLQRWLRAVVEQTEQVDDPCGWCCELQLWAKDALAGRPYGC